MLVVGRIVVVIQFVLIATGCSGDQSSSSPPVDQAEILSAFRTQIQGLGVRDEPVRPRSVAIVWYEAKNYTRSRNSVWRVDRELTDALSKFQFVLISGSRDNVGKVVSNILTNANLMASRKMAKAKGRNLISLDLATLKGDAKHELVTVRVAAEIKPDESYFSVSMGWGKYVMEDDQWVLRPIRQSEVSSYQQSVDEFAKMSGADRGSHDGPWYTHYRLMRASNEGVSGFIGSRIMSADRMASATDWNTPRVIPIESVGISNGVIVRSGSGDEVYCAEQGHKLFAVEAALDEWGEGRTYLAVYPGVGLIGGVSVSLDQCMVWVPKKLSWGMNPSKSNPE